MLPLYIELLRSSALPALSFSVYYPLTFFMLISEKSNKTILQRNWSLGNVNFISYAQGFLAMY
jgi:hypothetical protein